MRPLREEQLLGTLPALSLAERLRRLLSPTYGARSNASDAVDELARPPAKVVLSKTDLAPAPEPTPPVPIGPAV